MTIWIRESLAKEQCLVLDRNTPNACILAAAGSGKTRTLVHLLLDDLVKGVPPEDIICFTFTQKAAHELLARIHALAANHLFGQDITGMYVGTIHAWCLKYLQKRGKYYNFTPIDELQMDSLVSRLYDDLNLKKSYGENYPRAIEKFMLDMEIVYNEHISLKDVPLRIRHSVEQFLNVLESNRLMTFGGMIRYATDYLKDDKHVHGLRSLYVDEYQDVNPAQVALIKAMLPDNAKVVVVGDDLQCIYNWRGSDVTRILEFPKEFRDVTLCRLKMNYRSRPSIVQFGNKVSANITLRDVEKVMQPQRSSLKTENVYWLSVATEPDQATAVVEIVRRFIKEGIYPNAIAVLLRSVVGTGRPIVDALIANGIPVQCPILHRGGEFINDFILPVFDWLRQEHVEPRNEIEEQEVEKLATIIWQGARKWLSSSVKEHDYWKALDTWRCVINDGRNEAYDIRSQLYILLDRCKIHISPDDSDLMVGLGITSQIVRSVEEVHRRRLFGQTRRTVRGIITECYYALRRNRENFGESIPLDTSIDAVMVSTVHQAKGLEWPVVIIPNIMARRFPVTIRQHGSSFPDDVASRYGTSLDDERRLFFVAATRARERLFCIDYENGSGNQSVFKTELPKDVAEHVCSLSKVPSLVWKISASDIKEKDPVPLRIGLSDLLIYVECPYQFGLRRIVTIQPAVGEELGFGKSLHELIQRRFDHGKPWPIEELQEQAKEHVFMPLVSKENEDKSRKVIVERIATLEKIGAFVTGAEPEITVEVSLGPGIIHGVVDCVYKQKDGSVFIRDWKSSIHDTFISRYEKQLQFYAFALGQKGMIVSGADIIDVSASHKLNRLLSRQVNISTSTLKNFATELKASLIGIRDRQFQAKPSVITCTGCDMYRLCKMRCNCEKTVKSE